MKNPGPTRQGSPDLLPIRLHLILVWDSQCRWKMLRLTRQGCRESDSSFSLVETANLRLTKQRCCPSDPLLDSQYKRRILRPTSYWFSTFFFPHSLSFSDIVLYLPPHCLAYQREIWAAQVLSCHKPSKLLLHSLWLSSDFHGCGKCVAIRAEFVLGMWVSLNVIAHGPLEGLQSRYY